MPTDPMDPAEPPGVGPDPSPPEDSEPGLDVDAAFAEIIARWEPSPPVPEEPEAPAPDEPGPAPFGNLFAPLWAEPVDEPAPATEEEHFVPPPPPPLPVVEPRRKMAWTGLFGVPLLALLLIALGVVVPGWFSLGMVAAFVGGFGYLVATMGASPRDPWSGDDGAIL